ncbi:hypothetical protein FH972_024070 [Carpinus fangiana]|uniref:Uncharacterized protein n=1 Tax=Carpinus fangiana TaxID=176857 RepID=A0A5N6KXG3_9ROSI|nr:hypothetical protein FH972_024070 [Carpinus fangiana]
MLHSSSVLWRLGQEVQALKLELKSVRDTLRVERSAHLIAEQNRLAAMQKASDLEKTLQKVYRLQTSSRVELDMTRAMERKARISKSKRIGTS